MILELGDSRNDREIRLVEELHPYVHRAERRVLENELDALSIFGGARVGKDGCSRVCPPVEEGALTPGEAGQLD